MVKLLSTITLILAIIFFPPAALALISNNAVPGDVTYPIKRLLEDGIYAVASLNSVSKAWFSAARSDRRFKEFSTLIAQGKSASGSLNELVSQTEIAAEELKKVEDPVKKQELIAQLSESINKYDQKLEEVSQALPSTSTSEVASQPTTSTIQQPLPPTSVSTPAPAPPPVTTPINREDAEDAKKKFEEFKKKLEEESKKSLQKKQEEKKEENKENKLEKEERNRESDRDKKHN